MTFTCTMALLQLGQLRQLKNASLNFSDFQDKYIKFILSDLF